MNIKFGVPKCGQEIENVKRRYLIVAQQAEPLSILKLLFWDSAFFLSLFVLDIMKNYSCPLSTYLDV